MRYTTGPAALDSRVARDVALIARTVTDAFAPRAVVLAGSYGRGEGGGLHTRDGWRASNDYDLWVVEPARDADGRAIARELAVACGVEIDLAVVTERQLLALPPSQLRYDLQHGGRVLAGDPDVLRRMQPIRAGDIPYDDAVRLLFNRAAGLIGHFRAAEIERAARLSAAQQVQLEHAWTACGDAALILHNEYDHRFAVKVERAPSALAGMLGDADIAHVTAAYASRLGAAALTGTYADAVRALTSTLTHALGHALGDVAGVTLQERLLAWEKRAAGLRIPALVAAVRALSPVPLQQAREHARIQADCARMLLTGSDAERMALYGRWSHAFH